MSGKNVLMSGRNCIWPGTMSGRKMKGQDLVRWKKEVYSRIQELNKIFQEDEKLRKEARK